MLRLAEIGVPTHFIRRVNMREQLIKEVEIIPVEVIVPQRRRPARSPQRFEHGGGHSAAPLDRRVLPTSPTSWATRWSPRSTSPPSAGPRTRRLDEILNLALRINDFLTGIFIGIGLKLIDFKVEFGRLWEEEDMRIILADEISPDNCRLWDSRTNEKLDKDRFRRDLGGVQEAYAEIARRLGILPEAGPRDLKGPEMVQ